MRAATDSAGTLEGRLITVTGFTMEGAAGADLARWSSSAAPPMHIGAAAPHRSSCHDRRSLSRGHLAARRRQRGHRIVATLNIVHSDDDSNQRDADRAARQHLHPLSSAEPTTTTRTAAAQLPGHCRRIDDGAGGFLYLIGIINVIVIGIWRVFSRATQRSIQRARAAFRSYVQSWSTAECCGSTVPTGTPCPQSVDMPSDERARRHA